MKQGGAVEAREAHNLKVEGSKPSSAIFLFSCNKFWEHSSVVEHSTADRPVPSSNLGVPYIFFYLVII